jgi:hypothetical protein
LVARAEASPKAAVGAGVFAELGVLEGDSLGGRVVRPRGFGVASLGALDALRGPSDPGTLELRIRLQRSRKPRMMGEIEPGVGCLDLTDAASGAVLN